MKQFLTFFLRKNILLLVALRNVCHSSVNWLDKKYFLIRLLFLIFAVILSLLFVILHNYFKGC